MTATWMYAYADIAGRMGGVTSTVDDADALARIVRATRTQRRLTQAQLAEAAGVSRLFVIEIEKGHPRAEIGKVLTLLGALGLSTQVIAPRTRSLDEAEVDALLTSLLDHGLEQVAAEHRPAVAAALRRMLNSDRPGVVAQHLTRGSRPERFGQHWDHKPTLLRAFARGGRVADEHARDRLRHLGSATSLTRTQVARRLRDMMEVLDLDATALAEESERLRVADHDDLFDQPDTRDRITPASVNRVLEGAPPLRPGQLAFILRAAHMDVGRVQGGGDA